MSNDEDRYRRQAKLCREQASLFHDGPASEQGIHLAGEYERLADCHRALYDKQRQPKS